MSEPKQSWFYQSSHRHEIDPYWDSKDPQYYNRQVEFNSDDNCGSLEL